ncbi:MAG: DUF1360 domain-containing protein [Phocaeicola sp.]
MLGDIFLVSLFATFIICFMHKIKLVELGQRCSVKIISELFNCQFCLSFWVSVILSGLLYLLVGDAIMLAYPLFTTPIIRILL